MKIEFAERMSALGTETAFEVLAHAKRLEAQGRNIVHLEIGEPDFDTPIHITEAAIRALQDGYTHYTPATGLGEARAAVAEYVSHTRGITATPEQVVLVPGSKNVLLFALLSLVNPGDEVIYPDPGYPIYESLARFVGATLRPIRLREENDFRFDLDEFRAMLNPRTRLIILNSPHNPCGSILERSDIEAIAEAVQQYPNAFVLSDEIYSRIQYDGAPYSILSVPGMQEHCILLDGLSKAYAMTGWRLGFGVMHPDLAEKMSKLMINSSSCAAAFTQIATITALLGPQSSVDEMVAEFRTRRDLIHHELNQIHGVHALLPKGAFYILANVSAIDEDAKHLSNLLLEEGGVACLPGTAFGEGGKGYLRFSYANSQEKIREGMRRMKETLARVELAV